MKALKHLCELYFCMSALLFPLNTLSQVREVTTEDFSFRIERSGEATLIKALPTPGYLNFVKDVCTIPETVEVDGQTHSVTRIADDAFKWSAVKKIIVPACIKDIGKNAFQSSLLSEIELPESPLTLNTEAFRESRIKELRIPAQTKLEYTEFQGCLPETPQLQNILVEEGHPDLMDVDGVLCTKDGCLLAYPSARTGTYVTPKEIKSTFSGAFYGSHLSTLVFSEGMESVNLGQNFAVGMCTEQVRTKALGDTLIDLNIYIASSVKDGLIRVQQLPSVYKSVTLHFFNAIPCVAVWYMGVKKSEYSYLYNVPLRIEVPHGCKDAYLEWDYLFMGIDNTIEEMAEDVTLESLKIESGPIVYGDIPNVGQNYNFYAVVDRPVVRIDNIAYSINTDESKPVAKVANKNWHSFEDICNSPSLTIPDDIEHNGTLYTVTEIDDGAFLDINYQLQPINVKLNSKIRRIGRHAFHNAQITLIDLPATLEEVDYLAFCDLQMLEEVICRATNPPLCDENAWFRETVDAGGNKVYSPYTNNATLYVPEGCGDAYKAAVGWREFKNIVEGYNTGINNRITDEAKPDHYYYDLQGRQITSKPSRGLYIQDGRKVVVH